jgi:microfibrillar-associated protein 1
MSLFSALTFTAEEKEAEIPDIDDTDGLDPEAEFEAWRLRELARIKREKEAQVQRELEREEIERRRALPEEQRLEEDTENAKRTRDEKPKGQQKFLQKYWHKGAFHQVSLRFPPHCVSSMLMCVQPLVGRGDLEET